MKKEDLIKKLENVDLPEIELQSHKHRLKMALLNSEYFKEKTMLKTIFWTRRIVPVGVMAIAIVAIILTGNYIQKPKEAEAMGVLTIQITDVPPELNIGKALVTISDISVLLGEEENENKKWLTVVKESKTFDLIAIKDVKEFLGSKTLNAGEYTQIRLNVDEAIVTIDGVDYNLIIPSKTIHVIERFDIEAEKTTILTLDFVVQESIQFAGKDRYLMRPVIKVIQE